MRKLVSLLVLACSFSFGQKNPTTLSAYYTGGNFTQVGLSLERGRLKENNKQFVSHVINLGINNYDYKVDNLKVTGTGFVIESGLRTYINNDKTNKNFYVGNFFSYGNLKFDENFLFGKFEGTFSYFSLFSPEIGYKIKAKNFVIDPFAGIQWQWQIKGKGDIDNVNVNNWQPRIGIRIGYQF
ncbi:autotransporter domain-containing protein [Flavobacterium sp. J27]|uniref:autotransporter domain-containing protein n=1 Tax=Flavobacterium sp. J27 TaxID=2060419 RepID=UPI0010324C89|nr:autotransporter domain-containing protein [Flavobacterium sp. J27]